MRSRLCRFVIAWHTSSLTSATAVAAVPVLKSNGRSGGKPGYLLLVAPCGGGVDVETTGLYNDVQRVIEIAAVKIENGTIVGEFQSLINPERAIPHFISKLTGIRPDMVKDSPKFGEWVHCSARHNMSEQSRRYGRRVKP